MAKNEERIKFIALVDEYMRSIDKANKGMKNLIESSENANKSTKKLGDSGKMSMMNLYAGIQLAKQGYDAIKGAISKFITASNKEEDAVRRVNFLFGDGAKQQIKFADEMQRVTKVGNEQTLELISLAKVMGASDENMQKVIKGAIGLNSALGVDLNSAVKMVTAGIEGQDYTLLNRYIPSLRLAKTEAEKTAIFNDTLAKSFDVAKDSAKSFSGQMEQLKNFIGDEYENVGEQIKLSLGTDSDAIKSVVGGISKFVQYAIQGFRIIGNNIGTLVYNYRVAFETIFNITLTTLKSVGKIWTKTFSGLGKDLYDMMHRDFKKVGSSAIKGFSAGLKDGLSNIKADFKGFEDFAGFSIIDPAKTKESGQKAVDAVKETVNEIKELSDKFRNISADSGEADLSLSDVIVGDITTAKDTVKESLEEIKQTEYDYLQERMQQFQEYSNYVIGIGQNLAQIQLNIIANQYNDEKAKLDEKYANELISKEEYDTELQKLENKRIKDEKKAKAQQKAWAIAESIINTAVAVTKALPNIPLSVLVGVLGATQTAKIATQEFALGGAFDDYLQSSEDIALVDRKTGTALGTMQSSEGIITAGAMKDPTLRSIASAVNVAGGGRAFSGTSNIINNLSQPKIEVVSEAKISMDELTIAVTAKQNDYQRAGGNIGDI